MNKLINEELIELKGGIISGSYACSIFPIEADTRKKDNVNSKAMCRCKFNNMSSLTNTNKADGCLCECK